MIVKDKKKGQSRGFGFVNFSDPSVVDKVIRETHVINDRKVGIFMLNSIFFGYTLLFVFNLRLFHLWVFDCFLSHYLRCKLNGQFQGELLSPKLWRVRRYLWVGFPQQWMKVFIFVFFCPLRFVYTALFSPILNIDVVMCLFVCLFVYEKISLESSFLNLERCGTI